MTDLKKDSTIRTTWLHLQKRLSMMMFSRTKAVLTKNFNRLSQFIGVDRDYRQYEIRLNDIVDRNLVYNEFVEFTTTARTLVKTIATLSLKTSQARLLRYVLTGTTSGNSVTIGGAIASTYIFEDASPIGNFYKSLTKIILKE